MFLYVIFNNFVSFSFIIDIKLLYIFVNYGKLMFFINVKGYIDCYVCFVVVLDDIISKIDYVRFLLKWLVCDRNCYLSLMWILWC